MTKAITARTTIYFGLLLLLANPVRAFADQAWACQYTASIGLNWEGSNWKMVEFNLQPPFVLVQRSDGLTGESVAKVVGAEEWQIKCSSYDTAI